jgi:3-deoxy-D-manno-octulosonic-acid transferase
MSNLLFNFLVYCLHLLRLALASFFIFIPHSRKKFEDLNLSDEGCKSFREIKLLADFCFEVSSEGELEQVRPLLLYFLEKGKKIELIFSSPSVETKCLALQRKFNQQMRVFRLPLISLQRINNWVTAPVILFCRYDFFPELLLLKFSHKKFVLLSGAVKNNNWFKSRVFGLFDIIVASTKSEEERFKQINPNASLFHFDFRIQRINERWLNAKKTLDDSKILKKYISSLNETPIENRIIIGSAWGSDLTIFDNLQFIDDIKNLKVKVLIVPHQLNVGSIKEIENYFLRLGLSNFVSVLSETGKDTAVTILNMSGVLCELYSSFRNAYVGGGHERSIHSVFEPFFCNNQVYMGPKIHRSTEYDLLAEIAPNEIHVLFQPEQFYTTYMKNKNKDLNIELRNSWRQEASIKIEQIANAIDKGLNVK